MNELATEARVRELGDEGAGLLPHEPALAAMKFEEARDLALHVGMTTIASTLSSLVARTWQLRGSPWRCIHFSRRAVQDEPQNGGAHSTLAHFCQKAATKAKASGKLKRSLHLILVWERELSSTLQSDTSRFCRPSSRERPAVAL